jgi:hypothetical protein
MEENMKFCLHFRYVYTFYHFGEEELIDAIEERHEVKVGDRFILTHQEDGAFLVSAANEGSLVLTFPNKDNLVLPVGVECELAYDEFVDQMGDPTHNVYEGTVVFTVE